MLSMTWRRPWFAPGTGRCVARAEVIGRGDGGRSRRRPRWRPGLFRCSSGERRIAIFVACWHESQVIANMVRHNLATIRYGRVQLFLGAYPNDEATVLEIQKLEQQYKNVPWRAGAA